MQVRFLPLLLVLLAMVRFGGSADAQTSAKPGARATSKALVSSNEVFVNRVIELTNQERANAGLPLLKRQNDLSKAAHWMAEEMAVNSYFAHVDRSGRNIDARLPDFGYTGYAMLGENIAAGQQTPEQVVAEWMKSPGHRANLLNPDYREIGIAHVHAPNSEYQDYWVQDFGSRQEIFPLIINNDLPQTKSCTVRLYVHGEKWAQRVRFSNDGVHWNDWETFQPSRLWTLKAENGKQTVYAELLNGSAIRHAEAGIEVIGMTRTASSNIASR